MMNSSSSSSSSPMNSKTSSTLPDTFDLNNFCGDLIGHSKARKLIYFSELKNNSLLGRRAFQMALEELKLLQIPSIYFETMNRTREIFRDYSTSENEIINFDSRWFQLFNKSSQEKILLYENQLNQMKRDGEKNQIKESIIQLAESLYERGDYSSAISKYSESREFVSSQLDSIRVAMKIIRCSILSGSYSHVKTQVTRIRGFSSLDPILINQTNAALGLFYLKNGQF